MTVGSWDRSVLMPAFTPIGGSSDFEGKIFWKQWSGANSPRRAKPYLGKKRLVAIAATPAPSSASSDQGFARYVKNKALVELDSLSQGASPPRRKSEDQNAYSMDLFMKTSVKVVTSSGYYWNGTATVIEDRLVNSSLFAGTIGSIDGSGALRSIWEANDSLKLLNKLREKLQGSDFNASVALGEGRQTLRLVADSAIRIAKSLHSLRRGDVAGSLRSLVEGTSRAPLNRLPKGVPSRIKKGSKEASDIWLEIQYGWKPLVTDAHDAAVLLAHQLSSGLETVVRQSLTKKLQGVGYRFWGNRYTGTNPGAFPWMPSSPSNPVSDSYSTDYTILERRRVSLYLQERPSVLPVLGLLDPSQVLWELLPWSFVADWFIPIGQYLDARGISTLYKGVYVESIKRNSRIYNSISKTTTGYDSQPGGPSVKEKALGYLAPFLVDSAGVGLALSRTFYQRTVGSAPSVPLPTFKPLAKAASWQHCANAVALLVSGFSGKKVL